MGSDFWASLCNGMDSISSTKPKLVYKFHKFKAFVDLIY